MKRYYQTQQNFQWERLILTIFTKRSLLVIAGILVALFIFLHSSLGTGQKPGSLPGIPVAREFQYEGPEDEEPSEKHKAVLDFQERKNLYLEECKGRKPGAVHSLFIHPPSQLAVCPVPKVGCTFWKRAFRFLYKDFGGKEVKSLFDIDRLFVHFGATTTLKTYQYETPEGKKLADSSKKVLFTRDPYSRLWSGYVDKFLLPDSWADHGMAIVFSRKNGRRKCPDDITFEEFLANTFRNKDSHWRPIVDVCDPCAFKPHFVGHMDTFARDVKYILDDRNLAYLIEGHNQSNHVEDEISIMIDYHYGLYKQRAFVRSCLTAVQLAERLWKVFQLNGYLRPDEKFPAEEVKSSTLQTKDLFKIKESVIKIFIDKYRQNPMSHEESLSQRENVLKDAYRNVSTEITMDVQNRFEGDFLLFGFDPTPPGW